MKPWADLAEQWRERRPLRLGVYAIAGIVWLQGLLVWRDWLDASSKETLRVAQRIARLRSEAGEVQWAERARAAQDQLAAIDREVTRVGTLGLAQADLQDWLSGLAQRAGLSNPTVVVSAAAQGPAAGGGGGTSGARSAPEALLGLDFQVRAQLRSDFKPLPVYDLMAALEKGERRLWVESMSIRPGAGGRFELSLLAAYRKAAKASQ